MQDAIHVRPATVADLPVLRRFEQGVIAAERPFDPTLKGDPVLYYDLEEMLDNNDVALLVAESETGLVGAGYARLLQAKPMYAYKHYAYLGFMYVEPHFRGQGINQKIMNALRKWVIAKGVTELRLEVYVGNERAIRAYEKIGFSKLLVEMRWPPDAMPDNKS
ncbi:MAG TPA: GNAT family N-acetyltransferase [Chitinophagaceae bacterium]|nr:GNAT family N-acetyltransferase [Chitinophagaceae bacterium]